MDNRTEEITTSSGFTYTRKINTKGLSTLESPTKGSPKQIIFNTKQTPKIQKLTLTNVKNSEIPKNPIFSIQIPEKNIEPNCEVLEIKKNDTLLKNDEKTEAVLNKSSNGFVYIIKNPANIQDSAKLIKNSNFSILENSVKLNKELKRKDTDFVPFPSTKVIESQFLNNPVPDQRKKPAFEDISNCLESYNKSCNNSVKKAEFDRNIENFQQINHCSSHSSRKNKLVSLRLLGCPRLPVFSLKLTKNYSEVLKEDVPMTIIDDFLTQLDTIFSQTYQGYEILNIMTEFFTEIRNTFCQKLKNYRESKQNHTEEYKTRSKSLENLCVKIKSILQLSKTEIVNHSQEKNYKNFIQQ